MKTSLAITGVGIVSPIGQRASVCMHSVRSSTSNLCLLAFPDRAREWIAGGRLLRWTGYGGQRHWKAVLNIALSQAWQQAGAAPSRPPSGPAAMIVGYPEPGRPGKPSVRFRSVPREWLDLEGFPHITHLEQVRAGACNAHAAFYAAEKLFRTSPVRMCFIGVADSQLDIRTTRWHEENFRLKCSYNADGLMPAEAACFLVIEPEDEANARGATTIARVASVAGLSEPATVLSDQPNTSAALTTVIRTALADAQVPATAIGMVWSDLNGESFRAREWAFTEVRLGFQTHTELMHPADCHGDLGAATDGNLIGLAALCHGTGWSQDKPLLVFAGSENGFRAASVLTPGVGGFLQVSRGLPRVLSSTFHLPRPPDDDYTNSSDPPQAYFEWQLRNSHRDDLAALHYQRRAILKNETLPWTRLSDPEQRILNHIDAAVASGPDSMAAVADGLSSSEEGMCFAGAFMIGVLPARANLARLSESLERVTPARIAGIEAALMNVPSSDTLDRFIGDALEWRDPQVRAMMIRVAAKRRTDVRDRVRHLLHGEDALVLAAAAQASWRLDLRDCVPSLVGLLTHESCDVRCAALYSLLILNPESAVSFCRAAIADNRHFDGALAICLGIAGRKVDMHVLINQIHADPGDASAIEAIGILGAPACCPELIQLLDSQDETVKVAAARALDLISGLHATERVAVTRDPDDLPSTREREVERVNTQRDFWLQWWSKCRDRLDHNARWRRGGCHSSGLCIAELSDPNATLAMRRRALTELAMQGGRSVPYEPDWFAAKQIIAIDALRAWWRELSRTQDSAL